MWFVLPFEFYLIINCIVKKTVKTKNTTGTNSTNEAQTNETIRGNLEHVGGGVTSEWSLNIILISKKPKQHKQFFCATNEAQMEHKQRRLFGVNLEHDPEWSLNNILIAYLKNWSSPTNFFTAQTSTNGAQTIETVLGEFGACGGLSDLRKDY